MNLSSSGGERDVVFQDWTLLLMHKKKTTETNPKAVITFLET